LKPKKPGRLAERFNDGSMRRKLGTLGVNVKKLLIIIVLLIEKWEGMDKIDERLRCWNEDIGAVW